MVTRKQLTTWPVVTVALNPDIPAHAAMLRAAERLFRDHFGPKAPPGPHRPRQGDRRSNMLSLTDARVSYLATAAYFLHTEHHLPKNDPTRLVAAGYLLGRKGEGMREFEVRYDNSDDQCTIYRFVVSEENKT